MEDNPRGYGLVTNAKRREFNTLKVAFKAINNTNCPKINKIKTQTSIENCVAIMRLKKRHLMIQNTFQDAAASS